ncbi:MAG: hypothetical protein GC179_05290 [Anaerolineaceae bacterium]|nr:hypothetical protein [Anaerolineaceae bacterium]
MSFEVTWYDETQSIIQISNLSNSTWNDYHQAIKQATQLLISTHNRVDVIFYDTIGMPAGDPMPHLKAGFTKMTSYENMGLTIAVSPRIISGFNKIIIEAMRVLYRINKQHDGGHVASINEAITVILKDRERSGQTLLER